MSNFRIGVTADFKVGIAGRLEPLLAEFFAPWPNIEYEYFDFSGQDARGPHVAAADVATYDAVLAFGVRFPAAAFSPDSRLAVLARWGVGYDMIDVPACTAGDVLLAITPNAVRRPVAEAIVTLIHALGMRLYDKDRLVRTGNWAAKAAVPSVGLRGKTVASIGLGNIASEMFRLLDPFGLGGKLAFDPVPPPGRAAELGVTLVDLPTLFREADFLTINCPLTAETEGLVNAELIGLMKPTSYLINTARGPIVQQAALVDALREGRIAGAGLDVVDPEPLPTDHELIGFENVILAPHALAWTDELYELNSVHACENILTVLRGEVPQHTVNRAVIEQPGFQAKLAALRARW